ncbi:hypothetical protein E8E14_001797 [Neopestalotiopsis sp. 37M]|nr:hypothetical protein E8E14_001797 [Neopestalotiopsis sp. 37M]
MASFEPVQGAFIKVEPRYKGDPEPRRDVREFLKRLNSGAEGHDRPYCWGLTVYRTTYTAESEETFPRAIARLKELAHDFATRDLRQKFQRRPNIYQPIYLPEGQSLDPAPSEELSRRFYCDIIEDAASLDGADPQVVARAFEAWITEHKRHPRALGIYWSRYHFCIMLDEQGIDHLLKIVPGEPAPGYWREQLNFYVKVVSIFWQSDIDETRRWLRVGINDNIFFLATGVTDIDITEIGLEDPEDGVHNWYGSPFGR